jgi:hypothetical protein
MLWLRSLDEHSNRVLLGREWWCCLPHHSRRIIPRYWANFHYISWIANHVSKMGLRFWIWPPLCILGCLPRPTNSCVKMFLKTSSVIIALFLWFHAPTQRLSSDSDEYPATRMFLNFWFLIETWYSTKERIHTRCVSILANIWHAQSAKEAIGTATTGSSEAAQLGGLAMKKLWQHRRKAAGKSIHEPG